NCDVSDLDYLGQFSRDTCVALVYRCENLYFRSSLSCFLQNLRLCLVDSYESVGGGGEEDVDFGFADHVLYSFVDFVAAPEAPAIVSLAGGLRAHVLLRFKHRY